MRTLHEVGIGRIAGAFDNRIRNENLANGPSFVLPFWNIANWNLNDGYEPL
jgi:hypothetical protein